ncbi:MAG: radical SAM protein [Acidobacteriota bacterium]|nr:MAG: radical SAM protein [Acidobacteriota bacterium]
MSIVSRIGRHTRLSMRAASHKEKQTPPFMIVFINSICNLTCEHCFYWQNLNQRDDLSYEEFEKLSNELDEFENLNLSGGEPFIRKDFAEICELFIKNNGVKNIYVPTNGYFTSRTEKALRKVLENESLDLFVCELSLDGMPEYHNRFRGNPRSFEKAMETYEMLAGLQAEDPRLRIHANTVAMSENMDEIWQLTEYLYNNCPKMEHHNLAIIRGDRKNPSLQGPQLEKYKELYRHVAEVWSDREKGRLGSSVEPMLQWAKVNTIKAESQFVPCKAGILTGVVYANGDVSVCEQHFPLGNLREKSFFEIWDSEEAQELRAKIKAKACWCTNEVFLWSSIVFQPVQLTRAMVGVRKSQMNSPKSAPEKI